MVVELITVKINTTAKSGNTAEGRGDMRTIIFSIMRLLCLLKGNQENIYLLRYLTEMIFNMTSCFRSRLWLFLLQVTGPNKAKTKYAHRISVKMTVIDKVWLTLSPKKELFSTACFDFRRRAIDGVARHKAHHLTYKGSNLICRLRLFLKL